MGTRFRANFLYDRVFLKQILKRIDHAEMVALRNLIELQESVNHNEVTVYCTMEPCLMCYAALILAGIGKFILQ